MDCNRHVCLKDLENYLKKAEYLDGYTPTEQKQVRKNIGAIGEADLASYITETKFIPLTHTELVDLIKDNKLGIGQVYAITDFQTIYESNVQNNVGQYITWGLDNNPSEVYTIMTIALSANTLSFNNLKFINNDYTSMDVNKQISKINRSYVISYLDSDTLTLQVYRI